MEAPDLRPRDSGGDQFDAPVLPVGCPVTPLGVQGLKLWVLDASNQVLSLAPDCRKGDLMLIFGGQGWLLDHYPQPSVYERENDIPASKFDQVKAQSALVYACYLESIFDPQGRVFGRGAHRAGDDDDQLLLHMGRHVLIAGKTDKKGKLAAVSEHDAGKIDGKFYPALPALPPPAAKPSAPAEAEALMQLFGQWKFKEAAAAPLLLLGMSAQMHICGALSWRSHMWLAGPTATGKTTLQKLLRAIHAGWCLATADASEAAIRQVLKDDTLPVMIDEAERDDNPEKQRATLNLMKKASSGDKLHRGSADHRAQGFTAQSAFLFSSVLHGLTKGEEWNRVAVLDMLPLDTTDLQWTGPDLKAWKATGRRMHRRMVEQWPRFADTLADYKREIWSHGIEGRWQDTFGTLLACADCLLFDHAPRRSPVHDSGFGREKHWVRLVLPMMYRGRSQAQTDVERCLARLLSFLLPGEHGKAPEAIGQWIMRAMTLQPVKENDPTGGLDGAARARLKSYGLRLVRLVDGEKGWKIDGEPHPGEEGWTDAGAYLAVAYPTYVPLCDVFRATEWAGGGWIQSLGKVDGAIVNRLKIRFSGPDSVNAIAVPLRALRDG